MTANETAFSVLSAVAFVALAFGSADDKNSSPNHSESSSTATGKAAATEAAEPAAPAPAPEPEQASSGGDSSSKGVKRGIAFVVNNIETTVTAAKSTHRVSKNQFMEHKASEGAKLIVVDYTVKNTGSEPVSCLSFADAVTDAKGITYEDTLECNMAIDNWALETLNPGLKKKFQACFEVPEDASGFTMKANCMFQDGYFDLGI